MNIAIIATTYTSPLFLNYNVNISGAENSQVPIFPKGAEVASP